jgi:hypothetical protein
MAFGVLLFISPFVFGETSHQDAARSAYVLGALLLLSGILAAAMREGRHSIVLNAPGVVSVVTFISPWVFGFSGVRGIAWTAWVLAVATVLVAGTLRTVRRTHMGLA